MFVLTPKLLCQILKKEKNGNWVKWSINTSPIPKVSPGCQIWEIYITAAIVGGTHLISTNHGES